MNLKSVGWWAVQKFGKLRIKEPIEISTGSKRRLEFVCDCGKNTVVAVQLVTDGNTKSCGRCNEMPPEWWVKQKFGKLRLKNPKNLHKGSGQKEIFICECGKEKSINVGDVTDGRTTSCNNCNLMSPEWWVKQKFGKLRLKNPKNLHIGSDKKELFICDCGNEKKHLVHDVTKGKINSCGSCSKTVSLWFFKNRSTIRALQAPVKISQFPSGGLVPLETISKCAKPFRALCPICKKVFRPNLNRIKSGHSLTCGCSVNMISRPNVEIFDFVESKGLTAQLEYKLLGYKYDIFVKESKTLIEFNGTRFHSSPEQQKRDIKKKLLAENCGYKFISIEEKQWNKNKTQVKCDLISSLQRDYGHKTKKELFSKLEELELIFALDGIPDSVLKFIKIRKNDLINEMLSSYEDIVSASITSHHVMCEVKNMKPNEAFGNNPFIYYGLGLAGEAGELSQALLRVIRNGGSDLDMKHAVETELADCLIYAIILAYTTGIDLVKIVNEKARIVESRARAGYYGEPLKRRKKNGRTGKNDL